MENTDEEIKKQMDLLQGNIDEIKADFIGITNIVGKLQFAETNVDIINEQLKTFSKLIFLVEETGKKSATLFVNKNIYNDSTELTKYLHHSKLKMEGLKDSLNNKDKNGFSKSLLTLNRSLDSSEYILSLFVGEFKSEITKIVFKNYIDKKATDAAQDNMIKVMEGMVALDERMEKCERKIALLIRKRPEDFLEEDEAKILMEMINIHSQNVQWVEPRFLEKNLSIPQSRVDEIMDDFLHYGLLERKMRGGMKVYKYKYGE